jgi:OOP family OmpA-OmpF porin
VKTSSKKIKMKKQIILVLAILIVGALQAQETGNYLDFNVGGGFHNLSYTLQNGSEKGQFGYTINAGYSYFFTPQWGLRTGLGFQSFQSLSTLNYLSSTPDVDSDGQSFLFKANYLNWQERQTAIFIDIPLTVQFKLPVTKKLGLLTSVGGKISVPFSTSYKSAGGEFVTTGYYQQYNVELSGMPQHGFSTFTNGFKGDLSLKTSYMAIADLGGLYKLTDKLDLYVGGYINYGLNNILNAENKLIYQYNGVYNGLFASTQTNSINPISIGLKVGLYLHLGSTKSALGFEKQDGPIETVKPVEPVKSTEPVKPVQPIELVKPVATTEPVQPVEPAQTVNPVQTVVPNEPVKNENPVLEVIAVDHSKNGTELPKETMNEQTTKTILQPDSIQNDDAYERAKKIAASINILFGFNSVQVTNAKNDQIKELSDILKANTYIHLRFVGHTDNIGTHEVNVRFGMKRAVNVKQKFIDQGVSRSQLISESKAYDEPLVPNTSRANRAKQEGRN